MRGLVDGGPTPSGHRTPAVIVTLPAPAVDEATMRRAMIFGSVMASFNVEEFGTERVRRLTHAEINQRFRDFKRFTHFEEIPFERAVEATK
jgi:hypothetical protein